MDTIQFETLIIGVMVYIKTVIHKMQLLGQWLSRKSFANHILFDPEWLIPRHKKLLNSKCGHSQTTIITN